MAAGPINPVAAGTFEEPAVVQKNMLRDPALDLVPVEGGQEIVAMAAPGQGLEVTGREAQTLEHFLKLACRFRRAGHQTAVFGKAHMVLWPSGKGGEVVYNVNMNWADDEMRAVFSDDRFRQALSLALNYAAGGLEPVAAVVPFIRSARDRGARATRWRSPGPPPSREPKRSGRPDASPGTGTPAPSHGQGTTLLSLPLQQIRALLFVC